MYEWYNDHKPTHASPYWSRAYMKYVQGVAADEHARWPALLPRLGVSQLVTGNQWVNIGPTKADVASNGGTSLAKTDSGRVRTIIPAGSRLYVATAGGGVWRTDNNGATWTAITEVLGTLSIGSLAVDPANSNILYLGLGDPYDGTGIGFVKSTDGGDTWSPPIYLGDSSIIPQVFAQAGFVFAATNKGLYRSTDGGATFARVPLATGSMEAPYVWSIASTGAHALAIALEASPEVTTGTTDGQVWVSTDDGATWTKATGVTKPNGGIGRITLASAPSNPSIVYAMAAIPNSTAATDMADIFKSTNGGATWTALGVTNKRYTNMNQDSSRVGALLNGQGWYNGAIAVHPTNPNDVWFGGALLAAETKDGGSTFTAKSQWLGQNGLPYVHADFHAAAYSADGSKLYLGSDGGVFVSGDGGTSFSDQLNIGLTTHMFYSVGSSPAAPSAVIGGLQDNGTRVRSGSTSTFNQYLGGDGFGSHINQTNGAQMLGTLYYARIYKSTDGGQNFSLASSGITESNNSTTAPFITRINPRGETNELYTFSNTKVYKSTNYATSWTSLGTVTTTGVIRNVGIASDNANYIGVVGSGGRVWLTSNGGATWNQVAAGKQGEDPTALPDCQLSLSDIRFDLTDPTHQTIVVAAVAPEAGAGHLWKTTNGGTSWVRIDANGLPPGIPINLTKSDPADPNIVFAATHLGVYRSTDAGATWARFGGGMPFTNVMDLYISPDGSLVRAATFGRGIWELTSVANNHAPVLGAIGGKTVNHGATLSFTLSSTDQDNDTISYASTTLPAGAVLSPTGGFTYTPVCGDIGTKTITFTAQDGKGGTDSETITITVNGGRVGLDPDALDFGMVFTGGTTTMNVTASSTGTMPITFASATASDAAFTVPPPPAGPITTSTPIGVVFKPTAAQDYTATLSVSATDGTACTPTTTIPLTGHASTTSLGVAPMTPDFGDVRTDRTAYPSQAFTVTNMGATDISVSDVVLDDTSNFALDKGEFASATTLAPNATATFTVTAMPQTVGTHDATVTVMSNTAGDTAHAIAISANGVRPLLELSTSSLDFGSMAGTQNVTLTNTGSAELTLDGAVVTGSGATAYALSPTLPATLGPGAMFELMVAYTPDGKDTATLSITSDATASDACGSPACATAEVALSGMGSGAGDGGEDSGGCCDTSGGGAGQSLVLGLSILGLLHRRRR
jgi:photosystem II stability/assembly factor-like uncharacterized protein